MLFSSSRSIELCIFMEIGRYKFFANSHETPYCRVHLEYLKLYHLLCLTPSFFQNDWSTNSSSREENLPCTSSLYVIFHVRIIPTRGNKFKFIRSAFGDTESLEAIFQNVEKIAVSYPLVSIINTIIKFWQKQTLSKKIRISLRFLPLNFKRKFNR